jgi:hypothetical protein
MSYFFTSRSGPCWFARPEGTIGSNPHRPDVESHFAFEIETIEPT